jgi:diamine N-acetyltransferase
VNMASKPLEEQLRELPLDLRAQVRDYIEYLLARSGGSEERPATVEPVPDAEVTLREITAESVRDICRLTDTLTPPKKHMVAPNAVSIAQAYFEPKAWFRAVYADETPVGFVMLYDDADEQEYFLWRFMIAEPYHGKGFGRRAIELLADHVRTRPGAQVLETSCGQGPGSPEVFYRKVGFERSGKMFGREVGLSLAL